MNGRNSLGALVCLPLAMTILWQGSSCRSSKSEMNSNSASAENKNTNAAMNKNTNASVNKNTNASVNKNTSGDARQTPASVSGRWGGQHISIEVTESGAEIDYDCAHGSIAEGIVPDSNGKFVVKGFHVREHGGPIRADEDQTGQPAIYHGSIDGETMTLTVTLPGTNETVGTYTLTHGKVGRVRKCL